MIAVAALEPAVDHDTDARHRERGLGHVRGEDDLASRARREHPCLLRQREAPVQGKDVDGQPRQRLGTTLDLPLSGQEHEHVPSLRHSGDRRTNPLGKPMEFGDGRLPIGMHDLDGMRAPLGAEVLPTEVRGNTISVHGGGHRDQVHVPYGRGEQRGQQIEVQTPLVKLVEHHGREPGQRSGANPPQRHARGHKNDPGVVGRPLLVANHVADALAEGRALELCHPIRERPASHPTRLHDQHTAMCRRPARYLGRLARAGG